MQLVFNGTEPGRLLGVAIPHLVAAAGRMRNKRHGHWALQLRRLWMNEREYKVSMRVATATH
jgi:hypothetical protein